MRIKGNLVQLFKGRFIRGIQQELVLTIKKYKEDYLSLFFNQNMANLLPAHHWRQLDRFSSDFIPKTFNFIATQNHLNGNFLHILLLNSTVMQKPKTMHQGLSSKTVLTTDPNIKQALKDYFSKTYEVYEKIFDMLACNQAFYIKAEPLRHPLIFYYGHTAAVYINRFFDSGIIKKRVNPELEKVFAVGVDEMDWDDLDSTHYNWPTVAETKKYKDQVKEVILHSIDNLSSFKVENWHNDIWVILLGIEHERIHLETSTVIMRRVPIEMIKKVDGFVQCDSKQLDILKIPLNEMIKVSEFKGKYERDLSTFGWDNQFGDKYFDVKEFKASQMLASNGQFMQFIKDGGYHKPELWTEEGQRWIASIKPEMPVFWVKKDEKYLLRTLSAEIEMPWDWPAEVNNLEARAFCKWRTQKTGIYTRLPTQDEYFAIRRLMPKDQPEWLYQEAGNINMEYWMSPNPVNMFKTADFFDIVGNVWQHTITPLYPFNKFEIHPAYQDFSTIAFDNRHDILKGGSFMSTGNEALSQSRQNFRRHFNQFAGFRYIETDIEMETDIHLIESVSDKNVEMNLKHHYMNNESYVLEAVEKIKEILGDKGANAKALTVGCSVGRIPLELSKIFDESIGIDYTTRYFQMSTRLKQTGFLKLKDVDVDLKTLGVDSEKVSLLQMNPENPDEKKVNFCDLVVIDGYSLRKDTLKEVLCNTVKLAKKNATFIILNISNLNWLEKEEVEKILSQHCQKKVAIGQEIKLNASDNDQSYLPSRECQHEFRMNCFRLEE